MVGNIEKAQGGAEVAGREIEWATTAGFAETQAQHPGTEGREIEAYALPVRAVAVELGDDVARLASRPEDDAGEFSVDDQRRLVMAGRSRLRHVLEQRGGVERGTVEIGSPAALRPARHRALQFGVAELDLLQLDLLHAMVGTERRREAHVDPRPLNRGVADAAQMIPGKIERQFAGRRHARRLRPVELGHAQHRLAEIERDHGVAALVGEARQRRVGRNGPADDIRRQVEAEPPAGVVVERGASGIAAANAVARLEILQPADGRGDAAEPGAAIDLHLSAIEAKLQIALIEILLEGDAPDR